MPTYSEAFLEACASCPPSVRIYETLELWQSSFDQPARVVANVGSDVELGIEAGAVRNGGEVVTFIACPIQVAWPEQREGQAPSVSVKIDNVNRQLTPKIRAALLVRQYVTVTYRQYRNSDLTEPAYGPVEFELREVVVVGASLTGAVMVKNLQNKQFPKQSKNYDYLQFPSLLPT